MPIPDFESITERNFTVTLSLLDPAPIYELAAITNNRIVFKWHGRVLSAGFASLGREISVLAKILEMFGD